VRTVVATATAAPPATTAAHVRLDAPRAQRTATMPGPHGSCADYAPLRGADLANVHGSKYRMPWFEGKHNSTPSLDKSDDPWGTDAAVNTLCRVWGFDQAAAPEDIKVTQLQCAIVASTVRAHSLVARRARFSSVAQPRAASSLRR
jgi:hypothetical protein